MTAMTSPLRLLSIAAALTGGIMGCSDPSGPSLRITFATTGAAPDPDGYFVTVNPGGAGYAGSNGSVTIEDVVIGDQTVLVSGLAENCAVNGGNPRTVTIEAGEHAAVTFDVICAPFPAGVKVVEGARVVNGWGPAISLRLRNEGATGWYRLEFWALAPDPGEPPIFVRSSEEIPMGRQHEATVTYELETSRIVSHILVFTYTHGVGLFQTDLFRFE